jgi:hypothetical protein
MKFEEIRPILWSQFGAAIKMMESHMRACPSELWMAPMWENASTSSGFSEFWYVTFHTLFWFDLYLEGRYDGFNPPQPFDLAELDPAGVLPPRVYAVEELLEYLDHCRAKCSRVIEDLTETRATEICHLNWGDPPFLELLIDNLRHLQEHGAQLGMFLGQNGITGKWVSQKMD